MSQLPASSPVFLAWDFYLHDSQATPLAPTPRPSWDTTVQYIVDTRGQLLGDYMTSKTMQVGVL